MSNPTPTVSVIMVVHNAERYLAKAVESILNQTLKDIEFVIIDNGSSDRSLKGLKIYASKDDRIKLISQDYVSHGHALNEGIAQATGRFIAIADPADIAFRDRLKAQTVSLQDDPDCVALGCQSLLIDKRGLPLWADKVPTQTTDIENELLKGNITCMRHANMLFRRGPLLQIHGYDKTLEGAEEFDIFIRLLRLGTLKNMREALVFERYPNQKTQNKETQQTLQKRLDAFRLEHSLTSIPIPTHKDPTSRKLKHAITCARKADRAGNSKTAWQYAVAASLKYPFHPKIWFTLLLLTTSTLKRKYRNRINRKKQ